MHCLLSIPLFPSQSSFCNIRSKTVHCILFVSQTNYSTEFIVKGAVLLRLLLLLLSAQLRTIPLLLLSLPWKYRVIVLLVRPCLLKKMCAGGMRFGFTSIERYFSMSSWYCQRRLLCTYSSVVKHLVVILYTMHTHLTLKLINVQWVNTNWLVLVKSLLDIT